MAGTAGCQVARSGGVVSLLLLFALLCRCPRIESRLRLRSPEPELSELRSRISGVEELLEEFRLQLQRQGEETEPTEEEDDAIGTFAATTCSRGHFSLAPDCIIRTKDSLAAGATFLRAPAGVWDWRQCLAACCGEPRCSVAVLQQPEPPPPGPARSCYLFDCRGAGGSNLCSFSQHRGYSSYSLQAAHNSTRPRPGSDEPPHSNAGQDVVLQLPVDWVVLDGRESIDDHGIVRYEWALVHGQPSVDTKVPQPGTLQLSHLQEGVYTFQLTVTDTSGQRSSDNITVTVLPVKHSGTGCTGDCSRYQFTCDDGCCIDITFACDRVVQCPDGSDEAFCQNFSPDHKTMIHVAESPAQQRTMEWVKDIHKGLLVGNTQKTTPQDQPLVPLNAEPVTQSVIQELKQEIEKHLPDKDLSETATEDENGNIISKMSHDGGHPAPETGAVLPLALGLAITALLLLMVACRLRLVRQKLKKARPISSEASDYLINGMYL
ncbi:low-density lipoprotein receptor-related protein 11 [Microcaecilia unicolor]|uniref:Low-density lipoprotein receptor-related protein 11 n=1 Tax=Microcaecilia unicolor TaxID=1415580 RepID=A0A6P7XK15_9AMPH|nr:low-density lipoprotein receptor-related protein 11 [Microcaecilia unicolor]